MLLHIDAVAGETVHTSSMQHWLDSLSWQAEFAQRTPGARRMDGERDWNWYERAISYRKHAFRKRVRRILAMLGKRPMVPMTVDWLRSHGDKLWETRSTLADDLSRLIFDLSLVLRASSHRQCYFPRIDFENLAIVEGTEPFAAEGLPGDYLGLPLEVHQLTLQMPGAVPVRLRVICTEQLIDGLNSYRQYLVSRGGLNVSPREGDVVIDCGACIGDISLLFAAMVGERGQVHAFDPVPLHNRYCELQARLNPALANALHFNILAVGSRTTSAARVASDNERITPGQRVDTDSFDCTSLDDYAQAHLERVDFIKMDIEGSEMDALAGARDTIRSFKPRLAISGYHKPDDLWEIPRKIRELNPGYELTFGHHSPVHWESVFYAVQRD